jgi:hypothetical protein
MAGVGMTNDLSTLSDNFGWLPKGIFLGFDKAILDTYIPGSTYGLFRYEKDGSGGATDTLAFLSGQAFGGTTGTADGANTPAASNHQSAFWSMTSNISIDVSGSPNYTISRLIFEPIVDDNFDAGLAPDGYFNYSYIGLNNPIYATYSDYFNAGGGSASFPSHTFWNDIDTGMWNAGTNQLGFSCGGNSIFQVYSGGMVPVVNNTKESGLITLRWKKIWTTDIDSTYALNVSSDRNLKDNIQPTNLGLDFINDLNPVSYKLKDETVDTSTHYGIIAQDVIETLKNYGVDSLDDFGGITHDKEEDLYGARYTEFIPILMKAIQELSDEVKELKEKN